MTAAAPELVEVLASAPASPELLAEIQRARLAVAAEERRVTENDGMLFMKVFLPEYTQDESPEFHREMMGIALKEPSMRDLWNGMEGAVFAAPRGFAKSTIISLGVPIYWGCHKKKRFVVLISNTDTQADLLAEAIRKEFEENEHIKEVFGELRGDRFLNGAMRWTNQDFTIAHTNPPGSTDRRDITWTTRYIARGMLVRIRGAKSRHRRPDALILDDCENDENVQTPEQREKVWNFFTKSLLPMLDPHTGVLLVVGTVLHFDSLLARLLGDKYGSVYIRRLWKAIQDGVSIWNSRWPLERLERLKKQLTAKAWQSEMENNPIDEEARKFRPEWVQWYRTSDLEVRNGALYAFGQPLRIVAGVDQAIEEEEDKRSDESAIVVCGVTPDRRVLVLHVWHDRVDFPSQVQRVLQTKSDWKVSLCGMEKPAYQRALAQQVFLQSKRRFTGIRQLKNTAPKYERITGMSIAFERGRVLLRAAEPCSCGRKDPDVHASDCMEEGGNRWDDLRRIIIHEGAADLYDQLTKFPSHAHDDIPDALCNALQVVVGRQGFDGFF